MHNKMFIADGAFAIAGGRNIADEYFFSSKGGNFIDFDLLVCGDAVPQMQRVFDEYWNSDRIYPLHVLERSTEPSEALQSAFETLTQDAKDAFPAPRPDAPDILGFLPLSADMNGASPKLIRGTVDIFADDPEKVTGKSEAGSHPTTGTSRGGKAMA